MLGLSPAPYQWKERTNNVVANTSIEQLSPFNKVKLFAKSGANIRGAPAVAPLLDPVVNSLGYHYVLQGPELIPLLLVRTTDKTIGAPEVVAGAVKMGEGYVIFAPDGRSPKYYRALEQSPSLLRTPKSEFPEWIDRFLTNTEKAAFDGVTVRKAELGRLEAELSKLDSVIDAARQLKQLFVGTGTSFEDAVAAALSELGFPVTKGPHPRADLLVTDGHRVAAIEAKGVEGAAREEYVRQVMMWMPEVDAALAAAETDGDQLLQDYRRQLANLNLSDRDASQDCKGVLVLGTFRRTPLDQRTLPDFPENVKGVMVRQDICALTGLQLFTLLELAHSDVSLKEQVKWALFTTRGVLELNLDWKQVLEEST